MPACFCFFLSRSSIPLGLTLHLFVGAGAGILVAAIGIVLCYLGHRARSKKPRGKKSKVRISLASIKKGTFGTTDDAEEQLLDEEDPEQAEAPKCHDCRKISTPTNPCKCDRDIWENYVQDKPCMLQFSLYYNYHNSRLLIHVICAVNVTQKSWHGKYPSTRVRFQLLPSSEVYQTEVKSNTAEPMFNETFDFIGYSQSDIQGLTLMMGLYAYDRFSRKKMLGYLELPFETVSWDASHPVILWQNLRREPEVCALLFSPLIAHEHVSLWAPREFKGPAWKELCTYSISSTPPFCIIFPGADKDSSITAYCCGALTYHSNGFACLTFWLQLRGELNYFKSWLYVTFLRKRGIGKNSNAFTIFPIPPFIRWSHTSSSPWP